MAREIEPINILFSAMMVAAVFVLMIQLLRLAGYISDPLMVSSAVVLIIGLAGFLLNINIRLHRMEESIKEGERSVMVNIKSVEESVDEEVGSVARRVNDMMEEMKKRSYR